MRIIIRSLAALITLSALFMTLPARQAPAAPRAQVVVSRVTSQAAYRWAVSQHGKPYVWGGTGPYGYDCSGLVMAAFAHAGETVPRSTYAMLDSVKLVPETAGEARRGDLAFYGPGHVEFYDMPGATYGAHDAGTRIGWTIYNAFYHPSAYYRVAAGGITLAAAISPVYWVAGSVTVHRGDTLWSLAARRLGSPLYWWDLWRANRTVIGGNPNRIRAGEVLRYSVRRSFHRPRPVVATRPRRPSPGGSCVRPAALWGAVAWRPSGARREGRRAWQRPWPVSRWPSPVATSTR